MNRQSSAYEELRDLVPLVSGASYTWGGACRILDAVLAYAKQHYPDHVLRQTIAWCEPFGYFVVWVRDEDGTVYWLNGRGTSRDETGNVYWTDAR